MDVICHGPRCLDSSGTSTVTDISTVLKVSQDSAHPNMGENIHVEGLQQRDRRGEARQVVLSINEKRRRAGDSGNAKAATEIGLRGEILSQASVVLSAAWALEASGRIAETGLRSSGDVVRASWVQVSGSVDRRGTGRVSAARPERTGACVCRQGGGLIILARSTT
jgi:hypothetical protein